MHAGASRRPGHSRGGFQGPPGPPGRGGAGVWPACVTKGIGTPMPRRDRVIGPKYHSGCSIWAVKPYYLGPCTLRVRLFKSWGLGFQLRGLRF